MLSVHTVIRLVLDEVKPLVHGRDGRENVICSAALIAFLGYFFLLCVWCKCSVSNPCVHLSVLFLFLCRGVFVFATSFHLLNTVTEKMNGDIDIDHELM